ncbi:MAG: hypothetical protein AB2385_06035 [Symbiobacterium sp.]
MVLQEERSQRIDLKLAEGTAAGDKVRVYGPDEDCQCRVPIR